MDSTSPVSKLYELSQQLYLPSPIFTFEFKNGQFDCSVVAPGIGQACGRGLDKKAAKQVTALELLNSAQPRSASDFIKIRYSWTQVEKKTDKELANVMIKHAQAVLDLLGISMKPGYHPS